MLYYRHSKESGGKVMTAMKTMNKEQIMGTIRSLAKGQGFYSRLLYDLSMLDEDDKEEFLTILESKNFKDPVDLIMFLEG